MIWKKPHISKVYEAITAIADERIELEGELKARCYSSSLGKYYEVEFDGSGQAIMSNDNSAYYTGTLSYPMIALLMMKGIIPIDKTILPVLKGIHWKAINQKFKNNYDKSVNYVLSELEQKGVDIEYINVEIKRIYDHVSKLRLGYLGVRRRPPVGY